MGRAVPGRVIGGKHDPLNQRGLAEIVSGHGTFFRAPRDSFLELWEKIMPSSSPIGIGDLDAKANEALENAERMSPGAERTEALKRAGHLCKAAETYRYLFSNELKPPS